MLTSFEINNMHAVVFRQEPFLEYVVVVGCIEYPKDPKPPRDLEGPQCSILGTKNGDRPLPAWLLSGVAIAVCVGLFIWLRRTDRFLTGWGIGLVMGGAIGNVIDRARWGAVFDFADFHVNQWHWPAFNVADSAIVIGVGLMLIDSVIGDRQRARPD